MRISDTHQDWSERATRLAILLAAYFCFSSDNVRLSAAEGPQLAVFAMNADGTDLRKLVQAAGQRWHAAPSWSSDGKFVVFHAHPMDATAVDSHIFVVK